MAKVTVRQIIEMLAKCDWDSECSCISKGEKRVTVGQEQKRLNHRITGISQSTSAGIQIIFED